MLNVVDENLTPDAKVAKLFFASFFLCALAPSREIKRFSGQTPMRLLRHGG